MDDTTSDDEADQVAERLREGALMARPAIDGPLAWKRRCAVCAFRGDDPQGIGREAQRSVVQEIRTEGLMFYCLHRETRCGSHRVCATADAIGRADAARRVRRRSATASI